MIDIDECEERLIASTEKMLAERAACPFDWERVRALCIKLGKALYGMRVSTDVDEPDIEPDLEPVIQAAWDVVEEFSEAEMVSDEVPQ